MRSKTIFSQPGIRTLFVLLAGFTLHLTAIAQTCTTTTENYSSSTGWTQGAAGKVTVDNFVTDAVGFNAVTGDTPAEYVYKQLSSSLSNTSWTCDFRFYFTSGNVPAHTLIAFSEATMNAHGDKISGTLNYSSMDMIEARVTAHDINNNADWTITGSAKNGGNSTYIPGTHTLHNSASISLPSPATGQWFYGRLQRLSATRCMLSVFTDSSRTTHLTGSPVCWTIPSTIQELDVLQHGNCPEAHFSRSLTATIDDVSFSNLDPYITGTASACSTGYNTYRLFNCLGTQGITGATNYSWSLPSGSTYSGSLSGATATSISANIGSSGNVSCTVTFCTGVTVTYTYAVIVCYAPLDMRRLLSLM